jgi:RNA polymerase sigma-70 factor (ECF subfamily)
MQSAADSRRLYQKHFQLVYRTALRRGIPVQDADDVTQQVFAKALSSYNGARPFSPYVLQITRNEVCDFHKRRVEEPSLVALQARDEGLSAEERLRLKDQWRLLEDLLDRLAPERRIAFELAEVEQLSQAEIAEMLGIPVTTVESRLRDARAELQKAIELLRKRDALPAAILMIQALRDIEVPNGAQARGWKPVWRSILRRRAWRAARTCAVIVLPGLLPLPFLPRDSVDQAAPSDPAVVLDAIPPSGAPAAPIPRRIEPPESPAVEQSGGLPDRGTQLGSTIPSDVLGATSTVDGAGHPPARRKDARPDDPAQAELILMQGARRAWRAGNVKLALQELLRHKRLYPHGQHAQIREAMLQRIKQWTGAK